MFRTLHHTPARPHYKSRADRLRDTRPVPGSGTADTDMRFIWCHTYTPRHRSAPRKAGAWRKVANAAAAREGRSARHQGQRISRVESTTACLTGAREQTHARGGKAFGQPVLARGHTQRTCAMRMRAPVATRAEWRNACVRGPTRALRGLRGTFAGCRSPRALRTRPYSSTSAGRSPASRGWSRRSTR
jgi:hypothetical protein